MKNPIILLEWTLNKWALARATHRSIERRGKRAKGRQLIHGSEHGKQSVQVTWNVFKRNGIGRAKTNGRETRRKKELCGWFARLSRHLRQIELWKLFFNFWIFHYFAVAHTLHTVCRQCAKCQNTHTHQQTLNVNLTINPKTTIYFILSSSSFAFYWIKMKRN